jgi:hypothetical protein
MRRATVIALLAAALLAPSAAASDRSVYAAWTSRDDAFTRLGKQFTRAARIYRRSDGRRAGPTLRVSRKMIAVIDDVVPAIRREDASSDAGRRGKSRAITSLRLLRRSLATLRSGIRARDAARIRRSGRLARRSAKIARRAQAAFKQAGVP